MSKDKGFISNGTCSKLKEGISKTSYKASSKTFTPFTYTGSSTYIIDILNKLFNKTLTP